MEEHGCNSSGSGEEYVERGSSCEYNTKIQVPQNAWNFLLAKDLLAPQERL
jgi:hypothetical protein